MIVHRLLSFGCPPRSVIFLCRNFAAAGACPSLGGAGRADDERTALKAAAAAEGEAAGRRAHTARTHPPDTLCTAHLLHTAPAHPDTTALDHCSLAFATPRQLSAVSPRLPSRASAPLHCTAVAVAPFRHGAHVVAAAARMCTAAVGMQHVDDAAAAAGGRAVRLAAAAICVCQRSRLHQPASGSARPDRHSLHAARVRRLPVRRRRQPDPVPVRPGVPRRRHAARMPRRRMVSPGKQQAVRMRRRWTVRRRLI